MVSAYERRCHHRTANNNSCLASRVAHYLSRIGIIGLLAYNHRHRQQRAIFMYNDNNGMST